MSDLWTQRWDERYKAEEFAYGENPNEFLREQLDLLAPGKILFPAEGEGRNAVYAARNGWKTSAFDISSEGQKKAFALADKNKVTIDYRVGLLETLGYQSEEFDAMALIYAHFPAEIKSQLHRLLHQYIRKDGYVIFEAFSKKHLDYIARNEKVGGPRDLASLFSIEEIQEDFSDYEVILLEEKEIELSEGLYHNGLGSVIRFVGRKK
ncbi:MAG: class I SAM-dependent methyltransferase [Bacteroidetes bacterium]|nr:class I SAM-dependent methyltransferase [Bacteroidota bacterium]